MVPSCNRQTIQPPALDAYTFQSEQFITTMGLNIYDGALWSIAVALLGEVGLAEQYENGIFAPSKTCQFGNLRGNAPCKGVIVEGQCSDPDQAGVCGFCYGVGSNKTMSKDNAWTFRSISDYWSLQGTIDARCPELKHEWTWNDYKPILGENAWANLIGPLQVAFRKYGSVAAIPADDISLKLALAFMPSLDSQYFPSIGAVAFAPRNTLSDPTRDLGFDISLENNISLLGGLKALRYILQQKNIYTQFIPQLNKLIGGIEGFARMAFDSNLGYFRQGGVFNKDGSFAWGNDPQTQFAVDCQTWTISQLGYNWMTANLGAGSFERVWNKTKELGGYHYTSANGQVEGLGFTKNSNDQVFSGEWTFGAINMLRIIAAESGNTRHADEAAHLRHQIEMKLTEDAVIDGVKTRTVRYCNKRYWIPFGWFGNPLPSMASTAWAVFNDANFNPLHLGGGFTSQY